MTSAAATINQRFVNFSSAILFPPPSEIILFWIL